MVNSWKIALATMIIFGCGVLTGAFISRQPEHVMATQSEARSSGDSTRPVSPSYQLQKVEFLRKIEKHLELTPEQRDHLEKIMRQSQERTKLLWDQIAPQMREELKRVRDEIRAELTPEQKKKFETLLKVRNQRKDEAAGEEKRRRIPQQRPGAPFLPQAPQPAGSTN